MRKKVLAGMLAAAAAAVMSLSGCGSDTKTTEAKTTTEADSTTEASGNTQAEEKASEEKSTEEKSTEEKSSQEKTSAEQVSEEEKGQESAGADDLLAQIQEKGEIVVGLEGAYAPWNYHDDDNRLVGYDVEVAEKIAEKLGVTATFVECDWDGLLAGLEVGRYDIIANEVEIDENRANKYNFSQPYAYLYTALIVGEDNEEIKSFEDLDGKKTANTLSSTYAAVAQSYGAEVMGIDTLDQTIELLLAGRIDATLNADLSFYEYKKVHPDAKIKIAALTEEPVVAAIPARKGDDTVTLIAAIDKAIDELGEEGVLTELSQKYFNTDVSGKQE